MIKKFNFINEKFIEFIYDKIKQLKKDGLVIGDNNYFLKFQDLLLNNAKIFYRMNPDNKIDLIDFIKSDKTSVVAMCGDGANDCGALLSSDIGISLNDNDSTKRITSHFSYKYDSIACVDVIIRIGRANYENNLMILKFSLIYAELQAIFYLFLQIYKWDITTNQYFYVDCIVTLLSCILAAL
jgi:cation-transporting ATPase 13A2